MYLTTKNTKIEKEKHIILLLSLRVLVVYALLELSVLPYLKNVFVNSIIPFAADCFP